MTQPSPKRLAVCVAVFALSVVLGACSATTQGSSDSSPGVISHSEIEEIGQPGDAYTLVQHLEPQWLETRGRGSVNRPNEVAVYLENSYQGGPSSLRSIAVADVQKIEYLPPAEANMRFGTDHANGAIMVYMKDGDTR